MFLTWAEGLGKTIFQTVEQPAARKERAIISQMETPAEFFSKNKGNHQQALKMLGHPVSPASKTSKNSTGKSTTTRARRSASSSTSRHR